MQERCSQCCGHNAASQEGIEPATSWRGMSSGRFCQIDCITYVESWLLEWSNLSQMTWKKNTCVLKLAVTFPFGKKEGLVHISCGARNIFQALDSVRWKWGTELEGDMSLYPGKICRVPLCFIFPKISGQHRPLWNVTCKENECVVLLSPHLETHPCNQD